MTTDASPADAPQSPRPGRITAAAAVVAAQGVVVAGLGVTMLVMLLTGSRADDTVQALTGAATVLALAVLPLAAARGLWLLRRWSRGPAVIVQLMALPVGWQMAQNGGVWLATGAVIALTALAVLGFLMTPAAAGALGVGPHGPRDA
ncbi:hypothetical protein IQ279_21600 [Streptomyces verrucosisporus]|uniref:hypothetical protein n=1 Tax=Streptomyces verrucosisporus TaxID=1695161 RepID=UPI0019D22B42|nr:hypothetical protein [Streptomyces verrucosisporus]MBN3932187.1 hypothetical protein [Streptomyces verrucosisporus]